MKKLPVAVRNGLLCNAIPFFLTFVLLTAGAAGFSNTTIGPIRDIPLDTEVSYSPVTIGSVFVGLAGTLLVAVPVVAIDAWVSTNYRRLRNFAIFPLLAAEFTIGLLLLSQPVVAVSLFVFLQWTYWTFVWFIRDVSDSAPNSNVERLEPVSLVEDDEPLPTEPPIFEPQHSEPLRSETQPGETQHSEAQPGETQHLEPSLENLSANEAQAVGNGSESLDTDTTIENLEASMAELAVEIMKENET